MCMFQLRLTLICQERLWIDFVCCSGDRIRYSLHHHQFMNRLVTTYCTWLGPWTYLRRRFYHSKTTVESLFDSECMSLLFPSTQNLQAKEKYANLLGTLSKSEFCKLPNATQLPIICVGDNWGPNLFDQSRCCRLRLRTGRGVGKGIHGFAMLYMVKLARDLTRAKTPKGGKLEGKLDPLFQENPGLWNISHEAQ